MSAPVCRADANEGRLFDNLESMGIYGTTSEPLPPVDDGGLDNPLVLTFGNGECTVPQVPLPAAVWAGLAGGAGVFLKRRR
jgi:hypothetical protein